MSRKLRTATPRILGSLNSTARCIQEQRRLASGTAVTDLGEAARDRGIKYYLFSFVDLAGTLRSKLVPASAASAMQKDGAGFAGFAAHFDLSPADPDMLAFPDPSSMIQLPWKPEIGWVACNCVMDEELLAQAPRNVLNEQVKKLAAMGYELKTGVECEFHVIEDTPDGVRVADQKDTAARPCYEQQALMRPSSFDFIEEVFDGILGLGWEAYQGDHEDSQGQFEINWKYDSVVATADKHTFFKFMVKALAEKHGVRATFMPKPFVHLTGNGLHAHVSLHDITSGSNVWADPAGELGINQQGYSFLAGILQNADALCAITNPTVNSYKRINAPVTSSGATWAPNTISYTGNNRTHMVRIPGAPRFEVRLADGATNPYLFPAAVLACGIHGMENNLTPPARLDNNMYEEAPPKAFALCPSTCWMQCGRLRRMLF